MREEQLHSRGVMGQRLFVALVSTMDLQKRPLESS